MSSRLPSSSTDAFDELAAMFMTPADESEDEASPGGPALEQLRKKSIAAERPTTELLLVGHLPVRASVWLTPYADNLAQEVGPVALVRLDGDEPTLELLQCPEELRSEIAGGSLQETVHRLSGTIRAWIIRPMSNEAALDPNLVSRIDRLMLLSSADQAASVAAYQTFKVLQQDAGEAGARLPSLALTIVGSPPESATWMVRRLQATAAAQLGASIYLDRILPQIDTTSPSIYLRFTKDHSIGPLEVLNMIDAAHALESCQTTEGPAISSISTAESQRQTHRLTPRITNGRHHDHVDHKHQQPPHPPAEAERPRPAARSKWDPILRSPNMNHGSPSIETSRIRLSPKPSQQESSRRKSADEPTSQRSDANVRLASHVSGLRPLDLRSPHSANVELAIDDVGHLHLLANESHLRELRVVEAWVRSHHDLLMMLLGEQLEDPANGVTWHVFTDKPSTVADLHGTEIKLHVVAPVEVDGQTGWYVAALNH